MSLFAALGQLVRQDSSWINMITGRGTWRDKMSGARFDFVRQLPDDQLSALYYGSSIAARIVDEVVSETKRAGFEITGIEDDEFRKRVLTRANKIRGIDQMFETAKRARAFGGALGIMSAVGSGNPDTPMQLGARVESVRIVDRRRAQPVAWYDDAGAPDFGEPAVYQVTQSTPRQSSTYYVHATRCIRFDGIEVDEEKSLELNGWTYSILQRVYDNLKKYDGSTDSIATLLDEASIGVFKIKDLVNIINGKKKDDMIARMQIVDMVKSSVRSLMLDTEEDFQRVAVNFSGLDTASDRLAQRLASAAGMPLTILLGMSPAGLNATGESDARIWYNQVGRYRTEKFEAKLLSFLRIMAASEGATPDILDAMGVKWGNLWAPTAPEEADLYAKTAAADKIYFDMGLDYERIAIVRFAGGKFNATACPQVDVEALQNALTAVEAFDTDTKGFELTPSALEGIVTVEKALANIGLPSLPNLPDGSRNPDNDLPVEAYRAKMAAQQEAAGALVGAAEGAAEAATVPGAPSPEAPANELAKVPQGFGLT